MVADCSFRVQIKLGIGMDMISEMVNTTKTQAESIREILIRVRPRKNGKLCNL